MRLRTCLSLILSLAFLSSCGGTGKPFEPEGLIASGPNPSIPGLNAFSFDLYFPSGVSKLAELPALAIANGCHLTFDGQVLDSSLSTPSADGGLIFNLTGFHEQSVLVQCGDTTIPFLTGSSSTIFTLIKAHLDGDGHLLVSLLHPVDDMVIIDSQNQQFILATNNIYDLGVPVFPSDWTGSLSQYIETFFKGIHIHDGSLTSFSFSEIIKVPGTHDGGHLPTPIE